MKTAASKGRLTVAQSRKGRRPMSVDTMLRKEKEGTLFKSASYETFRSAFLDELSKIAEANGGVAPWNGELQKWASSDLVEEHIKEAFLGTIGKGMAGMVGKIRPAKSLATGVLDPSTGQAMSIAFGGGKGKGLLGGVGKSLEQSGKLMSTAPKAVGAGLPSAPGMAGRVGGNMLQSAGHHINHSSTAGLMLNPLGVPLGGAIEGATRGVGQELQRSGMQAAQRMGGAMVKHAPKAGLVGEVGAMGAMGAAAHLPFSAAGVIGGKMAPMLAHAGALGHIGQDAVGTAAQKLAPKVMPHIARAGSRIAGAFA